MKKRVPVLKDGEALRDEDGNVLEFWAVNQEELDNKIDAPQVAKVGEVLTVEEVDEGGKPVKWKTAAVNVTDVLKYTEQELTDAEQAQARGNIGAKPFDFPITITLTITDGVDTYSADKTFAEIKTAYESGANVYSIISSNHFRLCYCDDFVFGFSGLNSMGNVINLGIANNDEVVLYEYDLNRVEEKVQNVEIGGGYIDVFSGFSREDPPVSTTVGFPPKNPETSKTLKNYILRSSESEIMAWEKNQGLWHLDTLDDIVNAEPLTMYQYGNLYTDSGFAMKFAAYPNYRTPVIVFDANWLRFQIRYINNDKGELEEESDFEGTLIGMPFTIQKRPASAQNAVYGDNNTGELYTDSYTTSETDVKLSGKLPSPTTAQVGQIVKVKSVDESGKITETETVDMPTKTLKWVTVHSSDLTETKRELVISTDTDGKSIADYNPVGLSLILSTPADSTVESNNGSPWVYPSATKRDNAIRVIGNISGWKTIARDSAFVFNGGLSAMSCSGNVNTSLPTYKIDGYALDGVRIFFNSANDHLPVGTHVEVAILCEVEE